MTLSTIQSCYSLEALLLRDGTAPRAALALKNGRLPDVLQQ